jgi:Protein of unknown function (DUF3617)
MNRGRIVGIVVIWSEGLECGEAKIAWFPPGKVDSVETLKRFAIWSIDQKWKPYLPAVETMMKYAGRALRPLEASASLAVDPYPTLNHRHLESSMKKSTLAVLILLSGVASAQSSSLKAGLWEMKPIRQVMDGRDMTAQMAAAQARMQQATASMTPEQRKQMEAMTKKMGTGSNSTGSTTRICISPAMAARNAPMVDREGRCPPAKVTRSGNKSSFEFNCTNKERTTIGSGESTVNGDTISTNMNITMKDARGQHTMQTESQMTYLGSDCQGIKPVDQLVKDAQGLTHKK